MLEQLILESISERASVLGAMELGYLRGKIQEESRNTSDGFWLNHVDPADGAPSD